MPTRTRTIRGVMLDPARLIERPVVYRELVPLLGQWGYNRLLWHFIDDQGCAMVFPRRPEIASKHALTQRQTKQLVRHAKQHGLDVIPEVECFGHTGRIVSLPRYRHLRDGAKGKAFAAMCPFHPDARALLKDLLTDTAETFDSEFIHVGMDEVGFGEHPLSRKLLKKAKKWELFADHVNWLHQVVAGLGKRVMMWGDHLYKPASDHRLDSDAYSEKILDRIPRDIVICDWHYNPAPPTDATDAFLCRGFEVVYCPATSAYGMINHPSLHNLDNLQDSAVLARKRGIGTINTVWCPYRWLPGVILYALAYGAEIARTGGKLTGGFGRRFVAETFGLPSRAAGEVATAIDVLHQISPRLPVFKALTPIEPADRDADADAFHATVIGEIPAADARWTLVRHARAVRRHQRFYADLTFAAECLHELLARRGDAESHRALYRSAVSRWDASRFPDDPKRDGRAKQVRYADALVQRLLRTAQ